MKWGDQAKVLRLIPGLESAEFVRFGMVHRNTYINGPTVLRETWQTKGNERLFFAGQISGVEGYVESAASGLLAGRNAAALAQGQPVSVPPRTTAIGALAYYVSHANPAHYDPSNITFGIMAPIDDAVVREMRRSLKYSDEKRLRPARGAKSPSASERGWGPASTKKEARKIALSTRALADLQSWLEQADRQAVPR
jgi:methylenetetrahydrofolate--tRNA-(uracil-5-)-methyltransferase